LTVPQRSITKGYSGSPRVEIAGSYFDDSSPPPLPSGLGKELLADAKSILKENRHLWDPSQVDPVIRLARLRRQMAEMEAQIEREGYTITSSRGETLKHPLLSSISSTRTAILSIEKALGILFITRDGQVKKAEQGNATMTEVKNAAGVFRKLNLA
jgi:hypothetical protein